MLRRSFFIFVLSLIFLSIGLTVTKNRISQRLETAENVLELEDSTGWWIKRTPFVGGFVTKTFERQPEYIYDPNSFLSKLPILKTFRLAVNDYHKLCLTRQKLRMPTMEYSSKLLSYMAVIFFLATQTFLWNIISLCRTVRTYKTVTRSIRPQGEPRRGRQTESTKSSKGVTEQSKTTKSSKGVTEQSKTTKPQPTVTPDATEVQKRKRKVPLCDKLCHGKAIKNQEHLSHDDGTLPTSESTKDATRQSESTKDVTTMSKPTVEHESQMSTKDTTKLSKPTVTSQTEEHQKKRKFPHMFHGKHAKTVMSQEKSHQDQDDLPQIELTKDVTHQSELTKDVTHQSELTKDVTHQSELTKDVTHQSEPTEDATQQCKKRRRKIFIFGKNLHHKHSKPDEMKQ